MKISDFSEQTSLSKNQNKSIKNFLSRCNKTTLQLECFKQDLNDKSFEETIFKIKNLNIELISTYDNLLKHFKTNSKYNTVKDCAKKITNSVKNLEQTTKENLSKLLNIQLVNIAILRYQFLSCF